MQKESRGTALERDPAEVQLERPDNERFFMRWRGASGGVALGTNTATNSDWSFWYSLEPKSGPKIGSLLRRGRPPDRSCMFFCNRPERSSGAPNRASTWVRIRFAWMPGGIADLNRRIQVAHLGLDFEPHTGFHGLNDFEGEGESKFFQSTLSPNFEVFRNRYFPARKSSASPRAHTTSSGLERTWADPSSCNAFSVNSKFICGVMRQGVT